MNSLLVKKYEKLLAKYIGKSDSYEDIMDAIVHCMNMGGIDPEEADALQDIVSDDRQRQEFLDQVAS